jgi:hypothetical protein
MKNKKVIIALGVVVAIVLFGFFNKAEAVELEIGQYEQRIDGGLYTSEVDSSYIKAAQDLGVVGSLGLTGEIEYVDGDTYELYTSVGTVLGTPIGDISAGVLVTTPEGSDSLTELWTAYNLDLFGVGTVLDVSFEDGSQGLVELSVARDVISLGDIDLVAGGQVGTSYNYDVDYDYTYGFLRAQFEAIYVQVNYLKNDLVSTDWKTTTDFGIAFSF